MWAPAAWLERAQAAGGARRRAPAAARARLASGASAPRAELEASRRFVSSHPVTIRRGQGRARRYDHLLVARQVNPRGNGARRARNLSYESPPGSDGSDGNDGSESFSLGTSAGSSNFGSSRADSESFNLGILGASIFDVLSRRLSFSALTFSLSASVFSLSPRSLRFSCSDLTWGS